MRFTKVHLNALLVAAALVGIQIFVLIEVNGSVGAMLTGDCGPNIPALAIIFAPTGALCWIARFFASAPDDTEE